MQAQVRIEWGKLRSGGFARWDELELWLRVCI